MGEVRGESVVCGIDLAAQPARTAACVIEWTCDAAVVVDLRLGLTDADLLDLMRLPEARIGIDCPFGWPTDFVAFVTAHHEGRLAPPAAVGPAAPASDGTWRRPLANRVTDLEVRAVDGITPLSVSTDRIGHVALRLAALLAHCPPERAYPRDGTTALAEVYPAASLRRWVPHTRYKGTDGADARRAIVRGLAGRMPWLDLVGHEDALVASDDVLDSLVCALTARAVALGLTRPPAPEQRERARREGWIHVPTCEPGDLLTGPAPTA